MKTIIKLATILLFVLILTPITSTAQITVLDTGTDEVIGSHSVGLYPKTMIIELSMGISAEQDTTYTLTYRDGSYSHIFSYESIYFSDKETLLQFKDIVMSVFKDENRKNKEYEVNFTLPGSRGENILATVKTHRSMGITTSWLFINNQGHIAEVERNWTKVFSGL